MDFNSKYKSSEIEELLDKAGTAVQPSSLANVATSGSYNDLSNKPIIPDVSNKVDKESGKGLSTNDYTTTEKNKLAGIAEGAEVNVQSDWNVTDSSSDAFIKNKPTIPAEQVNADWNATSGKAQILNKPTIPAAVTESTVSGWGFTKNTGTYSKPSSGIPKTDLASAVQTSLDKADTALQSYTEQYKGTVTGVKINGSTKSPSSGTVDLGNVVTSIKINGSTKNPSSGVVDLGTVVTDVSGKQDKLVSGTNIKTINGQSILGSGDIAISGGGEEEYAEPYLIDYGGGGMCAIFAVEDDINSPMLPDVTYICPVAVMAVWVQTLQPPTGNVGKYTFHFKVGSDGAMVYIDESILMAGERPETLEPSVACELSIVATKIGNSYVYKGVLTSFS